MSECYSKKARKVARAGLEPATVDLRRPRSIQLSYRATILSFFSLRSKLLSHFLAKPTDEGLPFVEKRLAKSNKLRLFDRYAGHLVLFHIILMSNYAVPRKFIWGEL